MARRRSPFLQAAADYAGDSATLEVTDDDVPLVLSVALADASFLRRLELQRQRPP